ncbi:MAG TPA: hypothetical protein VMT05_11135, partial [Terriglobales bacterium]|nr:hypothetical protein [Terriglobales bacterium]
MIILDKMDALTFRQQSVESPPINLNRSNPLVGGKDKDAGVSAGEIVCDQNEMVSSPSNGDTA